MTEPTTPAEPTASSAVSPRPRRFTPAHRVGRGEPLVLVHGFTDTWRTWELVLPTLEEGFDVLAPTLPGHAGGPPLPDELTETSLVEAVEGAMDAAGFATAHVVGNSLGGYLALQLAVRGRARSVVALAPAGGWAAGDESYRDSLAHFSNLLDVLPGVAADADAIVATPNGRRAATQFISERSEHIPAELIAHQIVGAAGCTGARRLIAQGLTRGWPLDESRAPACPVRVVWGASDRILPWPRAAARYRDGWLAGADWVGLDGVGHCPQFDVPERTAELVLEWIRASA